MPGAGLVNRIYTQRVKKYKMSAPDTGLEPVTCRDFSEATALPTELTRQVAPANNQAGAERGFNVYMRWTQGGFV